MPPCNPNSVIYEPYTYETHMCYNITYMCKKNMPIQTHAIWERPHEQIASAAVLLYMTVFAMQKEKESIVVTVVVASLHRPYFIDVRQNLSRTEQKRILLELNISIIFKFGWLYGFHPKHTSSTFSLCHGNYLSDHKFTMCGKLSQIKRGVCVYSFR